MERPRIFLNTLTTNSLDYLDLLKVQVSPDARGLSFFVLSIDPDPNALYQILIAKAMPQINDLEITAIWTVELPHLTAGVYQGFDANDWIIVRHKTVNAAVTVKTGIGMALSEVVN